MSVDLTWLLRKVITNSSSGGVHPKCKREPISPNLSQFDNFQLCADRWRITSLMSHTSAIWNYKYFVISYRLIQKDIKGSN